MSAPPLISRHAPTKRSRAGWPKRRRYVMCTMKCVAAAAVPAWGARAPPPLGAGGRAAGRLWRRDVAPSLKNSSNLLLKATLKSPQKAYNLPKIDLNEPQIASSRIAHRQASTLMLNHCMIDFELEWLPSIDFDT
jgi:hypothetical protein